MKQKQHEAIALAEFAVIKAGLRYETNNNGVHLKVFKGRWRVADVWPTTCRYKLTDKGRIFGYNDIEDALLFILKINQGLEP